MGILNLHDLPDKRLYEVSRQLELYEQLSEDEGVHALIRRASVLFRNPVLLLDPQLRLITKATPEGVATPNCVSLISTAVCGCIGKACLKNGDVKTKVDESEEPLYLRDPNEKVEPRIMWKVESNKRTLAYLVIFETNVSLNDPTELRLAKTLSDVIALVLRQRTTLLLLEQGEMGSLLASILSGHYVGQSEIDDQLALYDLPQEDFYQMLLIPGVQENHQFLSIDYLAQRFAEAGLLPYFFYRDGSYVILFAVGELTALRGLETTVKSVLAEAKLKASMGERFRNLADLPWHFELCELLYDHCESKHESGSIYRIGPHILTMFLANKLDKADTRLIHPDIQLLYENDNSYHSELLLTWITYIKEHKHLNRTSEILGIHKNTLIYRIKKIHDMTTGIGQESDDIFYQLFSYEQLTQSKVTTV